MSDFQTVRLKPNPAGKDRTRRGAPASQLAAEWVDLGNTGRGPVAIGGLELHHLAYPGGGAEPRWEKVCSLTGSLEPGQVMRVHSGREVPLSTMNAEDWQGADFHAFIGRDLYVWNNAEGDCAGLWSPSTRSWVDRACYDAFPPEGIVLVRSGDKLVPAASQATWR